MIRSSFSTVICGVVYSTLTMIYRLVMVSILTDRSGEAPLDASIISL